MAFENFLLECYFYPDDDSVRPSCSQFWPSKISLEPKVFALEESTVAFFTTYANVPFIQFHDVRYFYQTYLRSTPDLADDIQHFDKPFGTT